MTISKFSFLQGKKDLTLLNSSATSDDMMKVMESPSKVKQAFQAFNKKIIEDIALLIGIYKIDTPLKARYKILKSIQILCNTFDIKELLINAKLVESINNIIQQEKNLVLKSMANNIIATINPPQ